MSTGKKFASKADKQRAYRLRRAARLAAEGGDASRAAELAALERELEITVLARFGREALERTPEEIESERRQGLVFGELRRRIAAGYSGALLAEHHRILFELFGEEGYFPKERLATETAPPT